MLHCLGLQHLSKNFRCSCVPGTQHRVQHWALQLDASKLSPTVSVLLLVTKKKKGSLPRAKQEGEQCFKGVKEQLRSRDLMSTHRPEFSQGLFPYLSNILKNPGFRRHRREFFPPLFLSLKQETAEFQFIKPSSTVDYSQQAERPLCYKSTS